MDFGRGRSGASLQTLNTIIRECGAAPVLALYDTNFSKLRGSTSDIREFMNFLKHFMDLLSDFKSPLSNCNWWRNSSSIADHKKKEREKKHKQKSAKK